MEIFRYFKHLTLYLIPISLMVMLAIPIVALAQSPNNVSGYCEIRFGGGGKTWSRGGYVNDGQPRLLFSNVPASDFIRSTSGPCIFHIYNSTGYNGRQVSLGTDLAKRIRAGVCGVDGTGDTWRIRSIVIDRVSGEDCKIRIGGNGVRMTYSSAAHVSVPINQTPAMNRISYISGTGCKATLYNKPFQRGKNKDIGPFSGSTYDPGYRVRSLSLNGFG
ncbi:MAG: hypothetical protein R3C14_07655 [Caldilineaceae bacterium]